MTCTSTSASMTHAYEPTPAGYRAIPLDTLEVIGWINRACHDHGIPVTSFCRRAMGDPRFYSDLMNGRSLRPATRAKIASFIASLGEA